MEITNKCDCRGRAKLRSASLPIRVLVGVLLLSVWPNSATVAAEPTVDRPRTQHIRAQGISGTLFIAGGGKLPESAIAKFIELAGGKAGRLVVFPTASRSAETSTTEELLAFWNTRELADVQLLHTRKRQLAETDEFVEPLKTATAVWFRGGAQSLIAEAYVGTKVETELQALLKRGGVIGGTSAGAAIQSKVMIASGNPVPVIKQGFDLLPGAVIDQHFLKRKRKPRLLHALKEQQGLFGIGIDEQTAVVVQGRRLRVIGNSTATICLSAAENQDVREIELASGASADLTALRRAAIARALPAFPAKSPLEPQVPNGSLVIVGGGACPEAATRFSELAGGAEARVVVIPTAGTPALRARKLSIAQFKNGGVQDVQVLDVGAKDEDSPAEFLTSLKQATGVWFQGGRQWRLVDAYAGTAIEKAFHDVLKRGGVIGGSSAGASIQAEYLVRGNPLGNREMMSEGYERGFGFLPGSAIDQHFSQRKRLTDMSQLKQRFPQLLGIGIDESTAIVVTGHRAEVVGKNKVFFYDRLAEDETRDTEYTTAKAGQVYDFRTRLLAEEEATP